MTPAQDPAKDGASDKKDLEKKLEEIQKEKAEKEGTEENVKTQNLASQVQQLEKSLKDQTEIAKRAQYDYVNLKFDMERHTKMLEEKSKTLEIDILISTVKKFLPFIENLRKSLLVLTDEQKKEPLAQGLQMTYDNFLKTLASLNIQPIQSIGLSPDSLLHEPVNVQPVEDKNLKGKIIQEFERWFVYEKNDDKRIVIPSKVIVGS